MQVAASCCMGVFSKKGTGAIQKTDGIMRKEDYLEILKQHIKTSAQILNIGSNWAFQPENDYKHTCKVVTTWCKQN